MSILVDYRCRSCGNREERWAPSPPPPTMTCAGCGAKSYRAWAAIGLSGRADSGESAASTVSTRPRRSMCAQYPQVPGLCHMSESAGRMWIAKYLKDGRAVDKEWERQEHHAAVRPPAMADAISHHHHVEPSSDAPDLSSTTPVTGAGTEVLSGA